MRFLVTSQHITNLSTFIWWYTFHSIHIVSDNFCQEPALHPNVESVEIQRTVQSNNFSIPNPPYLYNDRASYKCKPGYEVNSLFPRMCHGRKGWTNPSLLCVREYNWYQSMLASPLSIFIETDTSSNKKSYTWTIKIFVHLLASKRCGVWGKICDSNSHF